MGRFSLWTPDLRLVDEVWAGGDALAALLVLVTVLVALAAGRRRHPGRGSVSCPRRDEVAGGAARDGGWAT